MQAKYCGNEEGVGLIAVFVLQSSKSSTIEYLVFSGWHFLFLFDLVNFICVCLCCSPKAVFPKLYFARLLFVLQQKSCNLLPWLLCR